jgi:hypothetical protein
MSIRYHGFVAVGASDIEGVWPAVGASDIKGAVVTG